MRKVLLKQHIYYVIAFFQNVEILFCSKFRHFKEIFDYFEMCEARKGLVLRDLTEQS